MKVRLLFEFYSKDVCLLSSFFFLRSPSIPKVKKIHSASHFSTKSRCQRDRSDFRCSFNRFEPIRHEKKNRRHSFVELHVKTSDLLCLFVCSRFSFSTKFDAIDQVKLTSLTRRKKRNARSRIHGFSTRQIGCSLHHGDSGPERQRTSSTRFNKSCWRRAS